MAFLMPFASNVEYNTKFESATFGSLSIESLDIQKSLYRKFRYSKVFIENLGYQKPFYNE